MRPLRSSAMCATCVAQGVTYVGGALAGLQVMAVRARARRLRSTDPSTAGPLGAEAPDVSTVSDGEPSRTGADVA